MKIHVDFLKKTLCTLSAFALVAIMADLPVANTYAVSTQTRLSPSLIKIASEESKTANEDFLSLVNEERKKQGLSPLQMTYALNEVAKVRAEELTESFSHTRPDGTNMKTAFTDDILQHISSYTELIVQAETASEAFTQFMKSSPQRLTLLSSTMTNIGVGLAKDEESGKHFWQITFVCGDETMYNDSNSEYHEAMAEFVELINAEREKNNLSPVLCDDYLNSVSQIRAEELKTEYSHTRPDGTKCNTIIDEEIFCWQWCSELMLIIEDFSAENLFDAFMSIDSYKDTVLNEKVTHIGFGAFYDESSGEWYCQSFLVQICDTDSYTTEKKGYNDLENLTDLSAEKVMMLFNEERERKGLNPLYAAPTFNDTAAVRAKELTVQFSHTRPDGSAYKTAISDDISNWLICWEGLLNTCTDSEVAFEKIKLAYKQYIDDARYTHMGCSYAVSDDGLCCWNLFLLQCDGDIDGQYMPNEKVESAMGDINKDGVVDCFDLVLLRKGIIGMEEFTRSETERGDFSGDGKVGDSDFLSMIEKICRR